MGAVYGHSQQIQDVNSYGIEGRTRVAWLGVKVKLSGVGFSSIWTYCSMITT